MNSTDFTATLVIDQSPAEAFKAITNVRGWWSEDIEGGTEKLNDEFSYHYKDIHACRIRLTEVIPNKKVVWHVLDNYFNFIEDKTEWKDTKVVFEISQADKKTQIRFTHVGLVPEYECFNICRDAWTSYINNSLRNLIETGKGKPKLKEGANPKVKGQHFHTNMTVHIPAHDAFECINNVTKWWTENLEGGTHKLNDEFTVRFGDVHYSKQKLVEFIPDKKVVWLITDSKLNFLKDKQEWNNTKICFELFSLGNQFTQVHFTHFGLVPEIECYDACSNAWSMYIQQSLHDLLTKGKGRPELKEKVKAANA